MCAFFPPFGFQREQRKQQRRRQQTEPAVSSGRREVAHVQLGGRVFSTPESGPELCAFAPGQHEPPRGLRLPHVRPGGPAAGAQHARTPAPAAGLLVGTSNLQPCGFGLLKRLSRDGFILQKKKREKKSTTTNQRHQQKAHPNPTPEKEKKTDIRLSTCMKLTL